MLEILFERSLTIAFALLPVVMIIVEIFKRAGLVKRLVPAFSIIAGMLVSWLASAYVVDSDLTLVLFSGAISGAITCGLWDLVKISILGKK